MSDTPITEEVEEVVEEVEEDDFNFDEPEETEETPEPESKFNFELQYNKEKIVIDDEQKLRELAQKGMNYDKVQTKAQELENDALRQWAYKYMEEVGYKDPAEFMSAVAKQKEEELFESKVQEYLNRGYGEDVAREMAELKKENQSIKSEVDKFTQKTEEQKNYEEFLEWHGQMKAQGIVDELDPNSITADVWAKVSQGTPLKYAYMESIMPNIRMRAEQDAIKKITKNAETSTGAINNESVESEGTWSHDYIEKMANSKGEAWVRTNYDRIEKAGYFN